MEIKRSDLNKPWYRVAEIASMAHISPQTVRTYIDRGKFYGSMRSPGGQRVVSADGVFLYLRDHNLAIDDMAEGVMYSIVYYAGKESGVRSEEDICNSYAVYAPDAAVNPLIYYDRLYIDDMGGHSIALEDKPVNRAGFYETVNRVMQGNIGSYITDPGSLPPDENACFLFREILKNYSCQLVLLERSGPCPF